MKIIKVLLIIIVVLAIVSIGIYFFISRDNNTKEPEIQNKEDVAEDLEAPKITGVRDRIVLIGEEIDLTEGITAVDNIDGKVEINVEGEIDNSIVGSARIIVTAKDKSGNTASESFMIYVREPEESEKDMEARQYMESLNNSNSLESY